MRLPFFFFTTTSPKNQPAAAMQYTGPTYRFPPTLPEILYPAGVYVESTLRV